MYLPFKQELKHHTESKKQQHGRQQQYIAILIKSFQLSNANLHSTKIRK